MYEDLDNAINEKWDELIEKAVEIRLKKLLSCSDAELDKHAERIATSPMFRDRVDQMVFREVAARLGCNSTFTAMWRSPDETFEKAFNESYMKSIKDRIQYVARSELNKKLGEFLSKMKISFKDED